MFEFGGDELAGIEGYGIPWLVWIQLLILFLLIFLLVSFDFSTSSDLSNFSFTSSPSSSQPSICNDNNNNNSDNNDSKSSAFKHSVVTAATVTNRFHHQNQVRGKQSSVKGEMTTNKGRIIVREDPGSSSKETNHIDYHPCNYLRLAKLAFLKCLGLDFMAERSSSTSSSSEHIRKDR